MALVMDCVNVYTHYQFLAAGWLFQEDTSCLPLEPYYNSC